MFNVENPCAPSRNVEVWSFGSSYLCRLLTSSRNVENESFGPSYLCRLLTSSRNMENDGARHFLPPVLLLGTIQSISYFLPVQSSIDCWLYFSMGLWWCCRAFCSVHCRQARCQPHPPWHLQRGRFLVFVWTHPCTYVLLCSMCVTSSRMPNLATGRVFATKRSRMKISVLLFFLSDFFSTIM